MAAVNGDILIRSVILQASFTSFLFLGAGLGDVTLAANQVLLQFLSITAYALDGFAFAAEALVGQTIGSRDRAGLRRAAVLTSQWGVGGAAGAGARLRLGRSGDDRPDGDRAGGAGGGAAVPAVAGGGAAGRHRRLDARRHLHRRHRDAGDAQRGDRLGRGLRRGAGGAAARVRQPRALGGADGAERDARASRSGCAIPRWRRGCRLNHPARLRWRVGKD